MQKITTKQYFEESLTELVENKSFESITVREIVENCGMSTRTFYNYFHDKYDLMLWIYSSKLEEYMNKSEGAIDFGELYSFLADVLLKKKKLYLSAMQNNIGKESFMNAVVDYGVKITEDYIKRIFHLKDIPYSLSFSIRIFYLGGIQMGYEFLNGEMKITKARFIEYIQNAIPYNLKPYFDFGNIYTDKKVFESNKAM